MKVAGEYLHGTVNKFWAGCRCVPCRSAQSQYSIGRREARRDGDWQGLVSADKARAHLKSLGRNMQAVADVARMDVNLLRRVARGARKRILVKTESRILALTAEQITKERQFVMTDGVRVSAGPTKRRLKVLRQNGFTESSLGRKLNIASSLRVNGKTIRAWNALRIEKFYNKVMAVGDRRTAA